MKGKIWGKSETLLKTPIIEIHKLSINPNSYCSLHKHNFKWNAFIVVSGTLYISVHKNDYDLVDVTTLEKDQITTIPPGEFHKFHTLNSQVECFEIYYPELLSEDIIRKTVGGRQIILKENARRR